MKWRLVISIIFILSFRLICAQNSNPFEIIKKSRIDSNNANSISPIAIINPFELISARGAPDETVNAHQSFLSSKINDYLSLKSNPEQIKNMLFWLLLFLISLLAIAVNLNRALVAKLYKTSFNLNLFNMLYRENKEENRLVFPLLYGLYFAGMSIYLYLAIIYFKDSNYSFLLLVLMAAMMGIYVIRHLSLKLLSSIFNIGKEVDHYLFNIVCFGSLMAIIFIPLDFIIAFLKVDWGKKLIIAGAFFFSLAYIFRQVKEILASSSLWSRSILHFFLYLCAFELAPLAFLYIYIQRQGWV